MPLHKATNLPRKNLSVLMNEIARRSYLNAMGVAVFYLKQPLVHAKSSPAYSIPDEREIADKAPSSGLLSNVELPSKAAVAGQAKGYGHSELAKIRLELKTPAAAKRDTATSLGSKTGQEVPVVIAQQQESGAPRSAGAGAIQSNSLRFKLNYYMINSSIAIVDEQPHAQTEISDGDRLELLRNILTALEVDYSRCDFKAESIAWPLPTQMEFDESPDDAAEQMLNGFVAQKHRSHGFKHLLVFAGSLESLLEANKASLAAGFSMTITSSLSAMFAYPDLKRQVWQQLKPLIPVLVAH